jgi:TatD DNase family protein
MVSSVGHARRIPDAAARRARVSWKRQPGAQDTTFYARAPRGFAMSTNDSIAPFLGPLACAPVHDLIDIGANLTHTAFTADLEHVIERARNAGVATMIVTGTSVCASRAGAVLASTRAPTLYATAGVHPHDASSFDERTVEELRALAAEPAVRALGECGLDYNRNYSPRPAQLHAFEAQLALGAELKLPMFLHERDAHDDLLALVKRYRDRISAAVVHCFTGERRELRAYLDLDLHIGITGWICDERRGMHLRELVADIPTDRLMLETDAPYLLPRSIKPAPAHRRNEPAFLPAVLEAVAECTGRPAGQVASETSRTARAFFAI